MAKKDPGWRAGVLTKGAVVAMNDSGSAGHVTFDHEADPDRVVVHSTYAARNDIKSFNGWRRWDPTRKKWLIFPEDVEVFRSHLLTLGYVVHDQRHDERASWFEGLEET